jgi:predicted methyltransferase MtxX (methanogen marker protein 4)
LLRRIERLSRDSGATVGIGRARRGDATDVTVGLATKEGLGRLRVHEGPRALVRALVGHEVDAAVRGTLGADEVLHELREATGHRSPGRAALIELGGTGRRAGGGAFLLAPVGIDEGNTVAQRWRLLEACARTVAALGEEPEVMVMSKGRPEDGDRARWIARSLEEARGLVARAARAGIRADVADILVERALGRCNVLVAPDGVTGNLTFRLLHYVGGHDAWGALALHLMPGLVYVDTSRDKRDFLGAVRWAMAAAASAREV